MDHLSRVPTHFEVPIEPDDDGYVGRECPNEECPGVYFKVTPGTGIQGEAPFHCPYCGHVGGYGQFYTNDQVEYGTSIAVNAFTGALLQDLRATLLRRPPRIDRGFGLQISLEVKAHPNPIHYYREKDLETEVVCDSCGLRYAIYGLFGWCPDCGTHNSLQIIGTNLDLVDMKLALAGSVGPELAQHIVADALQTAISAFDAFGRETCRVHADRATSPDAARSLSFQNVGGARVKVQDLFGFDLAGSTTADEWGDVCRAFQKRHLFAHRGGVVDQAYLTSTHDPAATLGRKVPLSADEVSGVAATLRCLGNGLVAWITGQAAVPGQARADGHPTADGRAVEC